MTAQAKPLTLIDRLLALIERVRRRRKEPEFLDLHLHFRPEVTIHATDGSEYQMRLVGGCLKPIGLALHYLLRAPRDITLLRYRIGLGGRSEWQDAPPDATIPQGKVMRFTYVAVIDPSAMEREMAEMGYKPRDEDEGAA